MREEQLKDLILDMAKKAKQASQSLVNLLVEYYQIQ